MCSMTHFTNFLNQIESYLDLHLLGLQKIPSHLPGPLTLPPHRTLRPSGFQKHGEGHRVCDGHYWVASCPSSSRLLGGCCCSCPQHPLQIQGRGARVRSQAFLPLLVSPPRPCQVQSAWWRPSTQGSSQPLMTSGPQAPSKPSPSLTTSVKTPNP